jgi:hypothetical protein
MFLIPLIAGLLLILAVLVDAFETVVLPRQVSGRYSFSRTVNRAFWWLWSKPVQHLPSTRRRENYLSFFGPLSMLVLLVFWIALLVMGYALLYWALGSQIKSLTGTQVTFGTDLYASASAIFTSLGDTTPIGWFFRLLIVSEEGMGFAFLALVIGYVPPVYQSFANREVYITLLDARAGSPPTAFELLRRCGESDYCQEAQEFLVNSERWCAEILETHLSYPVLSFYRSQHDNQSWLAGLTLILDSAALALVGVDDISKSQGRLTFAMARHTIVDLAQVLQIPPHDHHANRLPCEDFQQMQSKLQEVGVILHDGEDVFQHLTKLRGFYEPYLIALSEYLLMPIPGWMPPEEMIPDNWKSTAWEGPGQVRL